MHDLVDHAMTTLIEVKVSLEMLAPIPSGPWLVGALVIAMRSLRRARVIVDAIAPDDADVRATLDQIDARLASSIACCSVCSPVFQSLRLSIAELEACLDALAPNLTCASAVS